MSPRPVKIALLMALALLLLPVAAASASSNYDLTGTWEVHNTAGPGADGTETLSMPDPASGAFTGEFAGFQIHGTGNGTAVQFEIGEAPGYVSYNEDTVEYNGTTLVMHGHWHDTGGQSGEYVETLQGGYSLGGGGGEGGEGGSSGDSGSVTISCDAYNPGNPLEYFNCTGQVAGNGGATLPTGTLTFFSNEGGFPLGSTCDLQPGSGASSCTVTFYPGYGAAVTIKAAYSGDANYKAASGERSLQPDLGQNPNRALEVEACALLYSHSCRGLLPKPDPVQTCISLVENCNGFGGAKKAEPGTIDMSGFPSSLITKAGCRQSAKNPFRRAAAAASDLVGSIAEGPTCEIEGLLAANVDPDPYDEGSRQYHLNLLRFQNEVDSFKVLLVKDALVFAWPGNVGQQFAAVIGNRFSAILELEKEEGKPGRCYNNPKYCSSDSASAIDTLKVCDDILQLVGPRREKCVADVGKLSEIFEEVLDMLTLEKHRLGLDRPYEKKSASTSATASSSRSAGKKSKGKRRRAAAVLAFGKVTLKSGRHGRLRLKVPGVVRTELRHAAHHGRSQLKAILTLTATQGTVTSTRRVHVKLLLRRRGGKHRSRRGHHG